MNDIVQENEQYSLAFSWGNDSGHEIVAYKGNGRLRLYDPQADIMYYGEWILKLLSMVDKKQTRLFRIDDKKMVDSYLTAVMKGAE